MYLLLTDETNLEPSERVKFLIYGGIFFPVEKLVELDDGIKAIRNECGYSPTDELKFSTRAKANVSRDESKEAKKRVLKLCGDVDCKFIAYGVLHSIAKKTEQSRNLEWAVNTVFAAFNRRLEGEDADGICLVDPLPINNPQRFLSGKFARGITVNGTDYALNRIRLFGTTWIGSCHAASALDVILGAFRFVVNSDEDSNPTVVALSRSLKKLIHRSPTTGEFLEYGLHLRPDQVRAPTYEREYSLLRDRLRKLLGNSAT